MFIDWTSTVQKFTDTTIIHKTKGTNKNRNTLKKQLEAKTAGVLENTEKWQIRKRKYYKESYYMFSIRPTVYLLFSTRIVLSPYNVYVSYREKENILLK